MAERALITGGSGFVGRHLASYLSGQGLDVHGLGRSSSYRPEGWQGQWHIGNLTDPDQIHSVVGDVAPDYVFHLAALVKGGSLTDFLTVNVIGTQNLLDALVAIRPNVSALVAGSAAEYGLARIEELPISEGSPLRPLDAYGVSKVAQSVLALQYAERYGLKVVRARTFNLTGPGEPDTLVCSAFARQIVEVERGLKPPVMQVRNLKSTRDFVDVRDAVRAYWLVTRDGEKGEVYNVCSGNAVRIAEVLSILLGDTHIRVEIHEDVPLGTERDVLIQYGDASKLRLTTGWLQAIPLRESLRDVLKSWRMRMSSQA